MKKGILLSTLLVFAITTTIMIVPQVQAAQVIIHDHPTETRQIAYAECSEYTNAIDGILAGYYSIPPDSTDWIWLRGLGWMGSPTGSVTVSSTGAYRVIYIQFRSSDNNDGIADIYVDDMASPIARIDNYNRGTWYVEIATWKDIHTVKVKASDNYDFTGVEVSPHHATPDIDNIGDVHVWFIGFADPGPVGGVSVPVDKFGLLAPYIALAAAVAAISVGAVYARKRWLGKTVAP